MNDKLLLLGLLRQSQMHGYQIYDFIENNLTSCTNLKKSSAYFLLGKMEKEGLIRVQEQRAGNRPPRRVYQLTPSGERQFWQWLEENLSQHTPTIFADDIGIAFLDQIDPQRAIELLQKRLRAMQQRLVKLEAIPPHTGSVSLLIRHQIQHVRNEIEWLNHLIQDLQSDQASLSNPKYQTTNFTDDDVSIQKP